MRLQLFNGPDDFLIDDVYPSFSQPPDIESFSGNLITFRLPSGNAKMVFVGQNFWEDPTLPPPLLTGIDWLGPDGQFVVRASGLDISPDDFFASFPSDGSQFPFFAQIFQRQPFTVDASPATDGVLIGFEISDTPVTFIGSPGPDLVFGSRAGDVIHGGAGADELTGGPGNDRLNTSGGSAESQGFGDLVLPGLGQNTIIGHEELWRSGLGTSISYADIFDDSDSVDPDGVVITAGPDGSGTVTGLSGQISDTFTFIRSFVGSDGSDRIVGDGVGNALIGLDGTDYLYGDGIVAGYLGGAAGQVFRLYQTVLDRAPDDQGYVNWAVRLYEGERTLLQVTEGFVASPEFQARYGGLDDRGFVELLYQNVLGRAADDGGLARWTGDLAGGASRAEVVLGFANSPEFVAATAAAANRFGEENAQQAWSDEVFRLYQAVLDRAPDQGGFENWTDRLAEDMSLEEVAQFFVASPEFQARYGGLDDGAFVELLYQNVLGRAADAAGLTRWTGDLAAGASRAEVVLGFSQSPEFAAATADGLKTWMRDLPGDSRDVLLGGSGQNALTGGLYVDTFHFEAGDRGETRILDLEPWDRLLFDDIDALSSVADVRAHLSQEGADTVFERDGLRIVLEDVRLDQITDDMIVLM